MRKVFFAFLGALFGLAMFAAQVRAQQPAQMPVVCGEYKTLADGLKKLGEQIVGVGTNARGVVEFWLDPAKGTGTVVLKLDMDKACMVLGIEDFKQVKAGKNA